MPATVKLGSTGPDVTAWQSALVSAGFPVDVTGTFDAATDSQTRAWQAAKGLVADGVVGPMSWGKMTGIVQAPSGTTDSNAQFGRDALLAAWPVVTGEQPSLAELQIAGAQAHLESNYGKSTYKLLDHATGQTIASSGVINNWGAIQGGTAADGTGFLATDTSPNKVTADNPHGYYDHHYRVFATPADGAAALVKEMTIRRPRSWRDMKAGDIDQWAKDMWSYTDASHTTLNKDPETGTLGYFEQEPSQRAKGIEQRVANIAFTLGEPVAARRGGPMPAGGDEGAGPLATIADTPAKKGIAAVLLAGIAWLAWRWFRRGG